MISMQNANSAPEGGRSVFFVPMSPFTKWTVSQFACSNTTTFRMKKSMPLLALSLCFSTSLGLVCALCVCARMCGRGYGGLGRAGRAKSHLNRHARCKQQATSKGHSRGQKKESRARVCMSLSHSLCVCVARGGGEGAYVRVCACALCLRAACVRVCGWCV